MGSGGVDTTTRCTGVSAEAHPAPPRATSTTIRMFDNLTNPMQVYHDSRARDG